MSARDADSATAIIEKKATSTQAALGSIHFSKSSTLEPLDDNIYKLLSREAGGNGHLGVVGDAIPKQSWYVKVNNSISRPTSLWIITCPAHFVHDTAKKSFMLSHNLQSRDPFQLRLTPTSPELVTMSAVIFYPSSTIQALSTLLFMRV